MNIETDIVKASKKWYQGWGWQAIYFQDDDCDQCTCELSMKKKACPACKPWQINMALMGLLH